MLDVMHGDVDADDDLTSRVVAEGVVDVDEADGLVPGLDSCVEEEHQALATESYLGRGLVEQRELAPVALAKRNDLDNLVTRPCRRSLP